MFFKNIDKLKPYQVEGAKFALSNFYTVNRDKPGMGKSAQALLAICKYLEKYPNRRALVICPSYLRRNWRAEIEEWTTLNHCTYEHNPPSATWDADIVIITYDQMKMFTWSWKFSKPCVLPLKKCRLAKSRTIGQVPWKSPRWFSYCDEEFGFVVIDEAHNLKNYKAKRTINAVNFITHMVPSFLMMLTGTPIRKKIQDIFILLYLMALGPRTKNKITNKYKSFFLFCYRFTNVVKTPFATLYKGVKNLEELQTYLTDRFIGREPNDLPEFNDVYITVDYKENPELLAQYESFNVGMEGKGAESALKAESANLKAPFTVEYVADLLEQDVGPVVIFTDHLDACTTIYDGLTKKGYKGVRLSGEEDKDLRAECVIQFQQNKYDFAVCTYGGASEGNNMTASCHEVINDFHWVPEVISQARGRIRRLTQKNRCTYHIMGGAVVDKKIWRSLEDAIKIIEKVWQNAKK